MIAHLDRLRGAMSACIEAGMNAEGILPGGLGVRRRAKALHERLCAQSTGPAAAFTMADPLRGMDWVDLFALAVNEENAAGGRLVTAPTNGAAGIVPSALEFVLKFLKPHSDTDSGTPGVDQGDDAADEGETPLGVRKVSSCEEHQPLLSAQVLQVFSIPARFIPCAHHPGSGRTHQPFG